MKKLLLPIIVLFIQAFQPAKAQDTIPNPSFETWTDDAFAGWPVKNPNGGSGITGWCDFNFLNYALVGGSPVTVFQDSANPSPYSGKYCAKIISDTLSSTSISLIESFGFTYPKTIGLILSGNLNETAETFKVGFPVNVHFQSFSFYYRYIPNGIDSCFCEIGMYHWNSVTNTRDQIGGGEWWQNSTISTWSPATVNIVYNPDSASVIPDTMVIEFSACTLLSDSGKRGDTMNIDYSSVVTAINNVTAGADNMSVYPNPANDEINLKVTGRIMADRVEIYDVTGNVKGIYSVRNNFLTINTQSYTNGLYLYKVLDNTGTQLNIGKFSVIK